MSTETGASCSGMKSHQREYLKGMNCHQVHNAFGNDVLDRKPSTPQNQGICEASMMVSNVDILNRNSLLINQHVARISRAAFLQRYSL